MEPAARLNSESTRRSAKRRGLKQQSELGADDEKDVHVVVQLELQRFGRDQDEGKARAIEFRRVYDLVTGS